MHFTMYLCRYLYLVSKKIPISSLNISLYMFTYRLRSPGAVTLGKHLALQDRSARLKVQNLHLSTAICMLQTVLESTK